MARLELDAVTVAYADGAVALDELSLDVADGELLALLGGPSSGRTTALEVVAGLQRPTLGRVLLDGVAVEGRPPRERHVALVTAGHALYPHLTVAENLAFPLELAGLARAEIQRRVEQGAVRLGISAHLSRRPAHLAAGQRRRVALARAVIRRPAVLMLDEPLADLDPRLRGALRGLIAEVQREGGLTTLYATGDAVEAGRVADRIAVIEAGRLHQVGAPDELAADPVTALVAGLVGDPPMSLLPGTLADGRLVTGLGELPAAALPAGAGGGVEVLVGLPARGLRADEPPAGALEVVLTVDLVERAGSELEVSASVPEPGRVWGGTPVTLRLPGSARVRAGERARLWLDPGDLAVFDASGRRMRGDSASP